MQREGQRSEASYCVKLCTTAEGRMLREHAVSGLRLPSWVTRSMLPTWKGCPAPLTSIFTGLGSAGLGSSCHL